MKNRAAFLSIIPIPGSFSAGKTADPSVAGFFEKLKSGEKCSVVVYGTSLP